MTVIYVGEVLLMLLRRLGRLVIVSFLSLYAAILATNAFASEAVIVELRKTIPIESKWGESVCAVSHDFKLIGSAERSGGIRVFELSSGNELAYLKGTSQEIASMAFSPDGRYLATSSNMNMIAVWDVASNKQLKLFSAASGTGGLALVFSRDGRFLLSAEGKEGVKYWDTASWQRSETTKIPIDSDLQFTPDGRFLVGQKGRGSYWSSTSEEKIVVINLETGAAIDADVSERPFALSSDLERVATRGKSRGEWDYEGGYLDKQKKYEVLSVSARARQGAAKSPIVSDRFFEVSVLAFGPDPEYLFTCGKNNLAVWSVQAGLLATAILQGEPERLIVSPEGTSLVTVAKGSIGVWRVSGAEPGTPPKLAPPPSPEPPKEDGAPGGTQRSSSAVVRGNPAAIERIEKETREISVENTRQFFLEYTMNGFASLPPSRSPFETEEEYRERLPPSDAGAKFVYLRVENDIVGSRISFKYDLPSQLLTVMAGAEALTSFGINTQLGAGGSAKGTIVVIDSEIKKTGTYLGSNAYGKTVVVEKVDLTESRLNIVNDDRWPSDVLEGNKVVVRYNIERRAAEQLTKNMEVVLGLQLLGYKYSSIGTVGHTEPKIDSPTEFSINAQTVDAKLIEVLLRDQTSGRIEVRYKLKPE